MWRTHGTPAPCRQHNRENCFLPEVSEGNAWTRRAPLARRDGTAHFREYLCGGVETVGRTNEDDPQRVSPDAVAKRGTAARGQAHGGFLLRRRRRAPSGSRSAAGQRLGGPVHGNRRIDRKGKPPVCFAHSAL